MNESQPITEGQKEQELQKYIILAEALSRQLEGFPFPGIDEKTRATLKEVDEEFPGYATPTDEIITRMEKEGIRVVLGEDPNSGNVFVLPLLSNDVEKDALFPRHLEISDGMNESLKALILANKAGFASKPFVQNHSATDLPEHDDL